MKLYSTQNFIPTGNGDLSKINYTQCHINFYYKDINPKIVKPVGLARQLNKLPLKIGITQF
jgi:hypothetical protein